MPHETLDGPLDPEIFGAIERLVGAQKSKRLLEQFGEELSRRLVDIDDHAALGRDAHAIISSSGLLGFQQLSEAARRLEEACLAGADVKKGLLLFVDARRRAILEIDRRLE